MAKFKFFEEGKWADSPSAPVFDVKANEVVEVSDKFAIDHQAMGKGEIVYDGKKAASPADIAKSQEDRAKEQADVIEAGKKKAMDEHKEKQAAAVDKAKAEKGKRGRPPQKDKAKAES